MTTNQKNHFQHFFSYIENYENDDRLHDDISLGNIEDDDPRLQDIKALNKAKEFIEKVYDLTFGDDSINRDWQPDEVIEELKSFSDKALKYDEREY